MQMPVGDMDADADADNGGQVDANDGRGRGWMPVLKAGPVLKLVVPGEVQLGKHRQWPG
jgi:hypothetical protein